jgi:sugar lactone lactonase YvrE
VAPGGEVKITGLSLAPIPGAAKGQPKAVQAKATVTGENLCGLTATFELRAATQLFTSAANDQSIFQIDFATGERTTYASGIPLAFGLTVDAGGKLYVLDGQSCVLGSLEGPPGAVKFEPISQPIPGCSRIAAGPDLAIYVAAGLNVIRVDLATKQQTVFGSIPNGVAKAGFGSTFLTGITFSPGGEVVVCEHWDSLFRFPVGGGAPSLLAKAPGLGLTPSDNPWNEGLAYGIDQKLYVGVFPSNPTTGFVYRAEDSAVIADLASIKAQVPSTNYTGIHGITWGFDGSMYFTNQNTQGNTFQPFGQVLVRRPDGVIQELSAGLNFDWPKGYDGDLLLGTKVLQTLTAPISPTGASEALLDGPTSSEPFQVRVLLTDPTSGAVYTATQIGQVQ